MLVGRVLSSWMHPAPAEAGSASAQSGRDVPDLFRAAWRNHTAKRAARAADVPVETARNWLRGRARPLAETLLRMAERDEALADALARRLDDTRRHRTASAAGSPPARDSERDPEVTR